MTTEEFHYTFYMKKDPNTVVTPSESNFQTEEIRAEPKTVQHLQHDQSWRTQPS